MSIHRNEVNNVGEKVVQELSFAGHFNSNNQINLKTLKCFTHSFLKISICSTTTGNIKLNWSGSNNLPVYENADNLDNPSHNNFSQYFHATLPQNNRSLKATSAIAFPSDTIPMVENTYRLHIMPIRGERCNIEINRTGSNADNGISIRVALSNNFHYVSND